MRRQHTVDLCGTSQRSARQATLDVRAITVTVKPPNARNELPPITYHVILVQESHPPESDTPVEWLLVTTLPIETSEALLRVIDHYAARWTIEVYFRTLKTGCRVDQMPL